MNKKFLLINFIVLMLVMLVGCRDNKQVDYGNATEGQITEEQASPEDIQIPDHWDLTIDGALSSTHVNADIILPDGYKNCNIVEYSDVIFNDEDIKTYADKIFDKNSYFLYMPYSQEEREALEDKLTKLRETATDSYEQFAFENAIEKLAEIDAHYQSDYDSFEELRFYEIYDAYWDRSIYKCDLIGTIDGVYYLLSFNKDKTNCYMKLSKWKQADNFQMQDTGDEYLDVMLEGNVCTYSQEQAEAQAREYVAMLGFDSLDIMQTNNVRCEYWDGKWWESSSTLLERKVDGYNIYFGRYYENYSMVYSSDDCRLIFEDPTDFGAGNEPIFEEGNEYIRVYIDSYGISEVEVYNPLQFEQVLSEETVMLPYSVVENIFKDSFKERADGNGADLRVYEIRLGYEMVIEGERKALVPTWFVFYDDQKYESLYAKYVYLRVNALDGTTERY